MVRAKEMHHYGIIRVNQGAYFPSAECFQVIPKLLKQLLTDTLVLVIGINADGI